MTGEIALGGVYVPTLLLLALVASPVTVEAGRSNSLMDISADGRLLACSNRDSGTVTIIDLATLTGSCVVALGNDVAGLMGNNQQWIDRVRSSADTAGEFLWQLPLFEFYGDLIRGEVADIKNTGGRYAGALTAGKFLENFVADVP